MARARRGKRSVRARRLRGDWVYRPSGEFSSTLGSYNGSVYLTLNSNSVGTGTINSDVIVLYDSEDYISRLTAESLPNAVTDALPAAARADGRRASVMRVQGTCIWTPTTGWASGASYMWGYRLIWAEQDVDTGGALLDALYSMWEPEVGGAVPHSQVAMFANDKTLNMREVRRAVGFPVDMPQKLFTEVINWKVPLRRAPGSKFALFMYLEAPANGLLALTTTNSRQIWNLRSYVHDPGA